MSDKNKDLYRRFIQEIFNEGRLERLGDFVSPHYALQDAPHGTPQGPDAVKQVVAMFRTAFTGLSLSVEELIAEGDYVAGRFTLQGVHTGPIFGIEGTGKSIQVSSLTMVRIAEGRLQTSWVRNDVLSLMRQLGVSFS